MVLMTSLFPSFVISLALVAFANGLWMSVDGFMVQPGLLNVFYRYGFHYWDYQKYVFENMMVNEFAERVYECAPAPAGGDKGCWCEFYPSFIPFSHSRSVSTFLVVYLSLCRLDL